MEMLFIEPWMPEEARVVLDDYLETPLPGKPDWTLNRLLTHLGLDYNPALRVLVEAIESGAYEQGVNDTWDKFEEFIAHNRDD